MKFVSVLLAVGIPAGCIIQGRLSRPNSEEFIASLQEQEKREWAGFEPVTLKSGPLPACDCPSPNTNKQGNTLAFKLSEGVTEALIWLVDSSNHRCLAACYVHEPDSVEMKGLPFGKYKLEGMCNGELVRKQSGSICEFKLKGGTSMLQDEEVDIYSLVDLGGDTLPFHGEFVIQTYLARE